jgi:hypothetical protein
LSSRGIYTVFSKISLANLVSFLRSCAALLDVRVLSPRVAPALDAESQTSLDELRRHQSATRTKQRAFAAVASTVK